VVKETSAEYHTQHIHTLHFTFAWAPHNPPHIPHSSNTDNTPLNNTLNTTHTTTTLSNTDHNSTLLTSLSTLTPTLNSTTLAPQAGATLPTLTALTALAPSPSTPLHLLWPTQNNKHTHDTTTPTNNTLQTPTPDYQPTHIIQTDLSNLNSSASLLQNTDLNEDQCQSFYKNFEESNSALTPIKKQEEEEV
jgi:hypothetical protein